MPSRPNHAPTSEPPASERTVPEARLHVGVRRLARLDAQIAKAEQEGDIARAQELRLDRLQLRDSLRQSEG